MKTKRFFWVLIALLIVGSLLLSACGGQATELLMNRMLSWLARSPTLAVSTTSHLTLLPGKVFRMQ